ncbi:MAG: hypothetical protein N3E47_04095 [Candidatus Bathyarchaeota archaeon]|nr:hypothetical protein [Candidatus Bathyarchaeota archaeon]
MSGVKRRYLLRESDRKEFLRRFSENFGVDYKDLFGLKPKVEVLDVSEGKIFVINDKPVLMEFKGVFMPTLVFEDLIHRLPKVVVDIGAVPHICNGADVMAPGVVRVEGEFREGDLVLVSDERHGKAIAITKALLGSREIKILKGGRVLKNLHHVGDSVWRVMIDAFQKRKS